MLREREDRCLCRVNRRSGVRKRWYTLKQSALWEISLFHVFRMGHKLLLFGNCADPVSGETSCFYLFFTNMQAVNCLSAGILPGVNFCGTHLLQRRLSVRWCRAASRRRQAPVIRFSERGHRHWVTLIQL